MKVVIKEGKITAGHTVGVLAEVDAVPVGDHVSFSPANPRREFALVKRGEGFPRGVILADRRRNAEGRWGGGFSVSVLGNTLAVQGHWAQDCAALADGVYKVALRGISPVEETTFTVAEVTAEAVV